MSPTAEWSLSHGFYGGGLAATVSGFAFEDEDSHLSFKKEGSASALGAFLGYEVLWKKGHRGMAAGAGVTAFTPLKLGSLRESETSSSEATNVSIFLMTFDLIGYVFPFADSDIGFHLRFGMGPAHASYDFDAGSLRTLYPSGHKTRTGILANFGLGMDLSVHEHIAILGEARWWIMTVRSSCGLTYCPGDNTHSTYAPMFSLGLVIH